MSESSDESEYVTASEGSFDDSPAG